MRLAAVALVVASLGVALDIPAASQDQPRFAARTDAVRVPVMVTRRGRPVAGLTRHDFLVLDNGVPQTVELLDREKLGLDVILALDASTSVWQDGLVPTLKAGALEALNELRRGDRAALVHFAHDVSVESPLTSNVPALVPWVYAARRDGATALFDAIIGSIVAAEPAPARRTLLMLYTGGLDTISWHSPADVMATSARSEVVVCAVVPRASEELRQEVRLGEYPSGWRFLSDLTARSGGELIEVDSKGLSGAFRTMVQQFAQGYQLLFYPKGVERGGWHSLDVRLRTKAGEIKARRGYHAG